MSSLRHVQPLMDIPFYYPCHFPLIHEVLRRQGCQSSLGLLAASRLFTLPSCSDTGLVKPYFHKLDYEDAVWSMGEQREMGSFEEGLAAIRERVGEGELFLATGSSYHLPYDENFRNPEYIHKHLREGSRLHLVDHWLAVCDIGERHVDVYDPVPSKYKGAVSLSAFRDFWKGHKAMPELASAKRKEELRTYGTMEVRAAGQLDDDGYREVLRAALATQIHEFLAARQVRQGERNYYFGQAVTVELLRTLHMEGKEDEGGARSRVQGESGNERAHHSVFRNGQQGAFAAMSEVNLSGDWKSSNAGVSRLPGLLFDMRWSRYFFRDLLLEAARVLGSPYDAYLEAWQGLILRWERSHKLLMARLAKRDSGWNDELSGAIGQLANDEWAWYEKMQSIHGSESRFVQRAFAGNEKANSAEAKREETLARIVLESCHELNAYGRGGIPVELGLHAPLYGRNGRLDSLGLVSLLAVVEQEVEDRYGISVALTEMAAASMPESPYRTVGSLVGYLEGKLRAQREGVEP
ncbi:hypothetical protein [Paenibacillus sp. JJ-223]|uniref:acyl carrier protein n=1 Tax=Paenibacillus sp. JJ-223 TaxID=2905647 RepID=UPI001F32077F|nr:hypothetical protein [Paenibacillus sp. JJ-223]CAH1205157.1 hypothetical protein PAECIP111890_02615 [Paenibacillus sp. JJ-223]